jgi:PAS domain S-box-containing protein
MSPQDETHERLLNEIASLTDELSRMRQRAENHVRVNEDLIDMMVDPADIVDETHAVIFQNRASLKRFGKAGSKKCYEFYHNVDSPCAWCTAVKSIRERKSFKREVKLENGTYLEVHSIPIPMPDGSIHSLEISRDITKSKETESEVDEKTRRLEILNRVILSANKAGDLASLMEEILNTAVELLHFDGGAVYLIDRDGTAAELVCSKGLPDEFVTMVRRHSITEYPFADIVNKKEMFISHDYSGISEEGARITGFRSVAGFPLLARGEVIGFLNVGTRGPTTFTDETNDILSSIGREIGMVVARMRAEQELKESEGKWRSLFENSIEGVFTVDLLGYVTSANEALVQMSGRSRQEIIGENFGKFCAPETAREIYRKYNTIFRTGVPVERFIYTMMTADGRELTLEGYAAVLRRGDRVVGFQGTLRDITERIRAQQALAEEKERLAVTLRSIGDGVITTDIDGRVVLINRAAEALTGFTQKDAEGRPIQEIFRIISEETRKPHENPAQRIIETAGMIEFERDTLLIARDGTERVIADSGSPIKDVNSNIIGVVIVFRDVTDKKRIEDELRKAQKLESLGTLAGGIAHDYNNILTAILANVSLARTYVNRGDKTSDFLDKMEKAAVMASRLTQQLLTFSRGGAPVKETVSLGDIIRDSAGFALGGTNVTCRFDIERDLWPVDADVGQISQVINNIIINAVQAMPAGGTIHVSARTIAITDEDTLPIDNGRYVLISIADEGCGISPRNLEKIFDPFFTTKQKGSGLGLSISYSIVKGHDGHILVQSKEGVGTVFHIYLPASAGKEPEKAPEPAAPTTGKGRILVMDDEESVRDALETMLGTLGYEARTARDGHEAVKIFVEAARGGRPFDLVITDLTVKGGMGGLLTLESLREIDPSVKVVVSSGYSNDPVMADHKRHGFAGVLVKPYSIAALGQLIEKVLRRG